MDHSVKGLIVAGASLLVLVVHVRRWQVQSWSTAAWRIQRGSRLRVLVPASFQVTHMPDDDFDIDRFWIDGEKDLARFAACTIATLHNWILHGCPRQKREDRKTGFRFNVAEVFRWYRTVGPGGRHERSKRKQIAPASGQKAGEFDEDEALFAGTEQTPALERWRLAKAKHAELDFEVKCGTLIPLQTAVSEFSQIASRWRMCGERLAREYGPDCAKDRQ